MRLELESRVSQKPFSLDHRLRVASLLHPAGDPFSAVRVVVDSLGDSLARGIDPAWQEAWELAWPRPYRRNVEGAVAEFHTDERLVYAVMREESTYRADVVSPVGARGLMQIMPPTSSHR